MFAHYTKSLNTDRIANHHRDHNTDTTHLNLQSLTRATCVQTTSKK